MATVLVVDDTPDIRLLLRAVLEQHQFHVEEAPNGAEALRRLDGGEWFDVVVLDVQMPDLDGWEVLGRIRDHAAAAEMPVILCTVKSQLEDTRRGWELGCDGFVNKPFSVTEVAEEVVMALSRSPGERAAHRLEALGELAGDKQ